MSELKACPFCGSDDVAVNITGNPFVECQQCGARTPAFFKTEPARERWNRRPVMPPKAPDAMARDLAACVAEYYGYCFDDPNAATMTERAATLLAQVWEPMAATKEGG